MADSGAPAPAVAHAVRLLQILRAAAPEQLGVSELSRRLGLGKASAHRILTTLVDEGCLILNPATKAYSLGPALIALGHAASGSADVLEAVRPALSTLAERSNLTATAFRALPDARLVAVASVSGGGAYQVSQPLGVTFPMAPPMGALQFAYASAARFEALVAAVEAQGLLASGLDRETLGQDVRDIRRRGFSWSVALGENVEASRREVEAWLAAAEAHDLTRGTPAGREHYLRQIERYAVGQKAARAPAPLFGLAVPIFDANAEQALHLSVNAYLNQAPPARVAELAELAIQAARTVTAAIGGREPSPGELARI